MTTYAVYTVFGVVLAVMQCPNLTVEECNDLLANEVRNVEELESYNYCTNVPVEAVGTRDLTPAQRVKFRKWVDENRD